MIGKRNSGMESVRLWQGIFDEYRMLESSGVICAIEEMVAESRHRAVFYGRDGVMLWHSGHGRKMLPEFTPDKVPTSVLAMDCFVPALPDNFNDLPVVEPRFLDVYQRISWGWSHLKDRKVKTVRDESNRLRYMYFNTMRERLEEIFSDDHN